MFYDWTDKVIFSNNSKTIRVFDAIMDDGSNNIPVRVFLIDEVNSVLKISIYIKCNEDAITADSHIKWVLCDIEELIGYDPNKTSRMRRWVAQFVDSFPEYVDQVYQSRD